MNRRRLLAATASLLAAGALSHCGVSVSTSPPATTVAGSAPQVCDGVSPWGRAQGEALPTADQGGPIPSHADGLQTVSLVVPTAAVVATSTPVLTPPDHLSIPSIGLEAEVVPLGWEAVDLGEARISRWEDLPAGAAGWHLNSGRPGEGTNIVISGHHNIAGEVFRDLIRLAPGDRVTLWAQGTAYHYAVVETIILPERAISEDQRAQNATWMQPTFTERLTLITCWPQWDNTHRLVVWARPEAAGARVWEGGQ